MQLKMLQSEKGVLCGEGIHSYIELKSGVDLLASGSVGSRSSVSYLGASLGSALL